VRLVVVVVVVVLSVTQSCLLLNRDSDILPTAFQPALLTACLF